MIAQKLTIVINPVSDACDLNCRYCTHESSAVSMSMEMAEELLIQVFSQMNGEGEITFSFQGGEPTLAGIDFFRQFTALACQQCPSGCHLFWAIQTHGLNLDDRWIELFLKYDFEVSVALDGYQAIHDDNRVDRDGAGTWKRTRAVLRKLRQHDVVVNALCTVTRQSARRPEMIYQSLRRLGLSNIILRLHTGAEPWALTPPHLGNFLCRVFDVWYEDWEKGDYCYIDLFDDYIRRIHGLRDHAFPITVNADGSIFVRGRSEAVGMLREGALESVFRNLNDRLFRNGAVPIPDACKNCGRADICCGGRRSDWIFDKKGSRNRFCDAYKRFFLYTYPRLVQIARETRET